MNNRRILLFALMMLCVPFGLDAALYQIFQITANALRNESVDVATDGNATLHMIYQEAGAIYYQQALGERTLLGSGTKPSIAVDRLGNPHVAFIGADGKVKYARRRVGAWQIAASISDGTAADIDVDANGFVHIAYLKSNAYSVTNLYYAHNKFIDFHSTRKVGSDLMPNPGVTQYLYLGGIKVDASGSYHIFYYGTTLVKGYPTSSASELTNKSGADVTTSSSTGIENVLASPNSIALDGTGRAHIAYVRNTSIYHAWIESGWQETVFKTGIDIATAAPAIAAKGNTIGIAYTDAAGKIQCAQDSGAGFGAPDQVDTGGAAALALGSAFICYIKSDGTDDEVFLATDKDLNVNLVGYWKFDAADDLGRDSSSYGNHGLVTASDVSFTPSGKVGGGAKFVEGIPDGAIEVPNSPSLDITGGITVAAWIKRDGNDIDGGDAIVSKGKAGTDEQYGFYAHHPLAQLQTSAFFNGTWAVSGSAVNPGTWYHVAMTYDGATVNFYKDGALIGTKPCVGGLVSNTSPIFIGASPLVNPEDYSGLMDELRIYDKVLTLTEIQALYAYNPLSITLSKSSLNFGAVAGGAATQAQSVIVGQTGTGTLAWTASPGQGWLAVTPAAGTGAGVLQVSVNTAGMVSGTYTGTILVADPSAANSPQAVNVSLVVKNAGATSVPFGDFATPVHGATGITGAIPVTGWVLDDIEVTQLRIWRDPVSPEGASLVFIGDAIFVEGARPDVELGYPDYPFKSRAGWGYMLLTNFLPAQGNGIFNIHAYAADAEGNQVLLGTKTITCDNAHATKPFGTIDTPTQGGDASGSPLQGASANAFVNFGWVLTPLPKTVPKDGSTITVWVDGVQVGDLKTAPNVYDQYRVDVATAFPGLNNSSGPVGAYFLDTTAYDNGVHTIFWIATDNAGAADGIGSRYFNIVNAGAAEKRGEAALSSIPRWDDLRTLPLSFEPILAKTGFNLRSEYESLIPDERGTYHIEIPEVNRIEIDLANGPKSEKPLARSSLWQGFLMVGEEARPLPIGSTFDARSGRFYWMPGPGFLGPYNLVFTERAPSGLKKRIQVAVTIKPK